MEDSSANFFENLWVLKRVPEDRLEDCINREKELITETLNPLIVPSVGVGQLALGLRPDYQIMRHCRTEYDLSRLPMGTLQSGSYDMPQGGRRVLTPGPGKG
jgi:hypothetical protein